MIHKITSVEQLDKLIEETGGNLFIKASLRYCHPCHMMQPIFEKVASESSPCVAAEVVVDEVPEVKGKLNVKGVPLFLYMKNGQTARRRVGEQTEQQLIDMFKVDGIS
jgi:thioredoxin 1